MRGEVAEGLRETVESELDFLERCWPRDMPGGVIHADLFPDNALFLGEHISGLIDFYFACDDAYAYDLAICFNAWCFDAAHRYEPEKGVSLINAYRRLRPLSGKEIDAFPIYARGAAIRFLLTRYVDWLNVPAGALVRPKDPLEYLIKLRFHRMIRDPGGYGFPR